MGLLDKLLEFALSKAGESYLREHQNETARPQQKPVAQTVPYPEPVRKKAVPAAVIEIPDEQFKDRNDIVEPEFPKGLTRIGRRAFEDCTCLEKVEFPSTLKEIDMEAFSGCVSLEEVIVPDGVRKIGDRAFYNCPLLEKVVFPDSMNGTQMGYGMFAKCSSLTDVTLPKRMSGEFFNVFKDCTLLTEIAVPEGVTTLGSFAFEYCSSLEKVTIPETVKIIEHRAFPGCTSLKEIYIPDSVRIIDAFDTFRGCSSLEKVRLPIGVKFRKKFDDDDGMGTCFWDCDSLSTVVLGDRSFEISETLDITAFNWMHACLAAERDERVLKYVGKNIRDVLEAVIMKEDADTMRGLLNFVPEGSISEADVREAIDSAGMTGVENVFDVLAAYAGRRGITSI